MNRSNVFWDKLASKYDTQVGKHAKTYANTVTLTQKHLKAGGRVFDFGCGTGITTIEIARYAEWVVAMDPAEKMLDVAKAKAENAGIHNIEFISQNIFDERFVAESFDAVMAFNVLYLLPDYEVIVRRIYDLLKPGGLFFSATDCLGESNAFVLSVEKLLSKLRIIPYIKAFTKLDVEELERASGFSILETACLYDSPPNYFIAARKE